MKIIIRITCLFIIINFYLFRFTPDNVYSQTDNINGQNESALLHEKTLFIVNIIKKTLKDNLWFIKDYGYDELSAYKFGAGFYELRFKIESEYKDDAYIFGIFINSGDNYHSIIRIEKERIYDNQYLKEKIIPVLLFRMHSTLNNKAGSGKAYLADISVGYNRTHDNHRFYPEYKEGSFYMSTGVVYDPAANLRYDNTRLLWADYVSCEYYFAYDSRMRENYFNVDILLYGNNKFESNGNVSKRTVYGFFNGLEFFRPGWSDKDVTWNRAIYDDKPHIQYVIWRGIQGAVLKTNTYKSTALSFYFSAGLGPSINSSLVATDISPEEEDELSPIFKSIKHRKQNYYYGMALPVRTEIAADKIWNFRFSAWNNFYYFVPIETDDSSDMLNIAGASAGYYIMSDCLLNLNYEYWTLSSKIHEKEKDHWWNRIIIELKFLF